MIVIFAYQLLSDICVVYLYRDPNIADTNSELSLIKQLITMNAMLDSSGYPMWDIAPCQPPKQHHNIKSPKSSKSPNYN